MTVSVETPPIERPHQSRFGLGSIMLLVGVVAVSVVFLVALIQQRQTQPEAGAAPNFTIETFDGETIRLADLRGKVVMINFWASWCGPCRAEAPELQAAWEHYEGRDDVVFLGIAYADNGPRSLEFLADYGVTYINGPDIGTRISNDYNIQGVPETFIIDKDGNIARFIYAGVTSEGLQSIIDRVLAGEDI